MRDVELCRAILGLTPPWTVAGVDLDVPGQQVVVHVETGPGPFPCPECGTPTPRYDSKSRRWQDLKVARAWTLKSAPEPSGGTGTRGAARKFFASWYWRATHSRLKPMAARGRQRRHSWVKKTARGFRNVEDFKTAIFFHCGGLDLYPHETQ